MSIIPLNPITEDSKHPEGLPSFVVDGAVSGLVNSLEEGLHALGIDSEISLFLLEGDLLICACDLHRLLHKHCVHDVQNREAKDASIKQEEEGEPLTDVFNKNATRWSPVREEPCFSKNPRERKG